jgi:hypothetical protein
MSDYAPLARMLPKAKLIGRLFIFGAKRSDLERRNRADHRQNPVYLPLNPRAERDSAEAKLCIDPGISCERRSLQQLVRNLYAHDLILGWFIGDIGHRIAPFM